MHLRGAPAEQQGHFQMQSAYEILKLIRDATVNGIQEFRKGGGKLRQITFMG